MNNVNPSKPSTLSKLRLKLRNPKQIIIRFAEKFIDRCNNFSYDFHKNGERELIFKLKSINPAVVLDVGANIGEWTKIALNSFPSASIHCFELSNSTYGNLIKNIKNPRAHLHNFGLSSNEGTFQYKDYGENSGVNTLLLNATYHDARTSPKLKQGILNTGDRFCRSNGIDFVDFLKIDVEGAEHYVLLGFEDMLKKRAIRLIQFEYGYTNGDSKFLMRDFYELFCDCGYKVGRIRKDGVTFEDWNYRLNDFKSGPNYVAIRDDDQQLERLISK
jgi:FkbM family methyltransferase